MSMCLRLSLHERERGIPVVRAAQSTPTAQPVDTIGPPVHWNAITIQPHSSDGNTAAGDSCVHCALFCTERVRLSARNRPSLAPTGSPLPPLAVPHTKPKLVATGAQGSLRNQLSERQRLTAGLGQTLHCSHTEHKSSAADKNVSKFCYFDFFFVHNKPYLASPV